MGRGHLASGVLTGALVSAVADLDPARAVVFTGITTVCALLPDVDHPDATLPRYLGWPGRVAAWTIGRIFGHRGLTHSVLGIGLLSAGLAFVPGLPAFVIWAILLGCVTHVLGDMLTISGVPLFWPLDQRFRIGWMRTGSFFETAILTPFLIACAGLACVGYIAGGTN